MAVDCAQQLMRSGPRPELGRPLLPIHVLARLAPSEGRLDASGRLLAGGVLVKLGAHLLEGRLALAALLALAAHLQVAF